MSKKEFLHGLACGGLSVEQIVQGFAEHYLLAGKSSREVCKDVCLEVSAAAAKEAGERLEQVFWILAGKEDGERCQSGTRTGTRTGASGFHRNVWENSGWNNMAAV